MRILLHAMLGYIVCRCSCKRCRDYDHCQSAACRTEETNPWSI